MSNPDAQSSQHPPVLLPGEGAVLLPCEPDQFTNFIAGLLGQPQTIERSFLITYDLYRQNIVSLHHLICQRVLRQNEGSMVDVNIKILFDDRSSVTLTSIDQFESYVEVNDVSSIGVEMKWVFLLKFRDKLIPERQAIFVGFDTDLIRLHSGYVVFPFFGGREYRSQISVRIEHTDRTWGVDIDNILKGHLSKLDLSSVGVKRFFEKYRNVLISITYIACIISVFVAGALNDLRRSAEKLQSQNSLWNSMPKDSILLLISKFDYYIAKSNTSSNESLKTEFLTMISMLFVPTVLWALSVFYIENNLIRRSFIPITDRSEKRRDYFLGRYNKNWIAYIFSGLFSISFGVLGNIVYYIIFRR